MNRHPAHQSPLPLAPAENTAKELEQGEDQQREDQQREDEQFQELTLRQAQEVVDRWIRSIGVRYFSELTNMAQLVEEVGEVARIISRTYGEQSWKPGAIPGDLGDELADVLFVILCLANQTGIDLQTALAKNLTKKTIRDATRHTSNPKLTGGR